MQAIEKSARSIELIDLRTIYPFDVDAVEADRWQELGAAVYSRGHIRKYAEIVGLNADELIAAFNDLGPATATPSLIPPASTSGPSQNDRTARAKANGLAQPV